jgi:hypothetical protein
MMRALRLPGCRTSATSLLLLLTACSDRPSPDYFPLDEGLHWEYRVHEKSKVVDKVESLSLRNVGDAEREGQTFSRRLAGDGNEYWLRVSDSAVLRAGVRTAIDFEPRLDESPRIVMQMPPAPGQAWDLETRPFILERIEPFRERFYQDDSKRITLRMQVGALGDVVEVAAGRFERCLRLDGSGLLNVLADARIGASEVPVTQTEWYAPGVGLVKLVRTETLDTTQIVGGEVVMELVAFER